MVLHQAPVVHHHRNHPIRLFVFLLYRQPHQLLLHHLLPNLLKPLFYLFQDQVCLRARFLLIFTAPLSLSNLLFELPKLDAEPHATANTVGRGHSKGIPEWNTGEKVHIMFDSKFQPIGERAAQLKSQLGKMVRDGRRIPLTILDWKAVDLKVKEEIWDEVKVNAFIDKMLYVLLCLLKVIQYCSR